MKNSCSNSPVSSIYHARKISVESRNSGKISSTKSLHESSETSEGSRNSTPTFSRDELSNSSVSGRGNSTRGNLTIQNRVANSAYSEQPKQETHSSNSTNSQLDNCNVEKIQDSNAMNSASNRRSCNRNTSDLSRQSDHVSCEDLLEFACDGPNVRRTRGPRNGEQSDEVRIMLKVLHEQSTPESCVAALNVTDWDVLAAIKLERLQGLLKKENNFVGLEDCKVMLGQCGGDVVKAAALLRSNDDTAAV